MTALRAGWLKGIQETEAALADGRFHAASITLTHTNFPLHYQCQNNREAQAMYGRVVTRIAKIQTAGAAAPGRGCVPLSRDQPRPSRNSSRAGW